MSLKFILPGKVLLTIIIFTVITFSGIIYTSIKSLQLDREHLSLLKLSKNIDLEIAHSRIVFTEYFLFNNSAKKTAVLNHFTNAEKYIFSLDSLIETKYKKEGESGLRKSLESVSIQTKQLQNKISATLQNNTLDFNQTVLTRYHNFQAAHQDLQQRIERYISNENSKFKQKVFILVLLTFILFMLCILLIHRIINSYNTIEKQQALRSLEVEFKERKRIAADLHDGLGSILSSIALFIRLIEKDDPQKAENKNLAQVKELSGIALESLEAIIYNLNPSILNKYGLIKSLEIICDKINDIGEVNCVVDSPNSEIKLKPNVELNVFRICNELINNTLKHAEASELHIDIRQIKKTVIILYRDNGKGFNPEIINTSDEEKMGLQNIINRIESLGGKYEINSAEGKGVKIMLSFNL
ncbi:MAG: sensor histidine kinase [Draconibacterium sp.]